MLLIIKKKNPQNKKTPKTNEVKNTVFFFLSLLFLTMIKRFLQLQRLLKTIHRISGNYTALHCSQLLNLIKEP